MRTLNSFQVGPNPNDEGSMPEPVTFPSGQVCTRLRIEAKVTLKNNGAGVWNVPAADLVSIAQKVFGTVRVGFGKEMEETVDPDLTYARLRRLCQEVTTRDCLVDGVEIGTAVLTTLAAGASRVFTFELVRPFTYERFGEAQNDHCPGQTQMQQLKLKLVRGSAITVANITQEGAAQIVVSADHIDGPDRWANVFRLYRNAVGGLEHNGPPGGGGLLAMWEESAAGAATALGIISLLREGDTAIHSAVAATRVQNNHEFRTPLGAPDPNSEVTVLHRLERYARLGDVPTSSNFKLQQHDSYLAAMQTEWLYFPTVNENYRDQIVGVNVTSEKFGKARDVLGVNLASLGGRVDPHDASISSVALLTPDDSKFALMPGRMFRRGSSAVNVIPTALQAAVKDVSGSIGGQGGASKLAEEAAAITSAIPGLQSPRRGAITDAARAIAKTLSPNAELATGAVGQLARATA